MPCCCIKTLNLCRKPVCGVLEIDQLALHTGDYTLVLDFLETTVTIVQAQVAGENIFFFINKLNESFEYTGQIFDSLGEVVTITDSPDEYDCIKFRTIMQLNSSGASSGTTPPVLDIPGTVVIYCVVDQLPVVTGTTDPVTGIVNGSNTIQCDAFVGVRVIVIRGNIPLFGIDPLDGSAYFTKTLASDFITLNTPLVTGEPIRIQTIPQ